MPIDCGVQFLPVGARWVPLRDFEHFDLPDLVGALGHRPCWSLKAVNAKGKPLPMLELSAFYRHALGIYALKGASEGLNLLV